MSRPGIDAAAKPVPCASCTEPVVVADMLAGPPRHLRKHEVAVDPEPLLPADGLLLHMGRSTTPDRWLLLPLDDDTADQVRQSMVLPHAHRQHVCAVVPTAWPALAVPTQLASA